MKYEINHIQIPDNFLLEELAQYPQSTVPVVLSVCQPGSTKLDDGCLQSLKGTHQPHIWWSLWTKIIGNSLTKLDIKKLSTLIV